MVLAVFVGCTNSGLGSSSEPAASVPSTVVGEVTSAGIDATFVDGECGFVVPAQSQVRCGTVTVPANWSAPTDEWIELAVAVFSPTDGEAPAESDPVVYLDGGPGGHALETIEYSYDDLVAPLLARGEVIVFDQRGVGLSRPRLHCDEVDELARELEDVAHLDDEEADERFHLALGQCLERLESDGVDVTQYNTANNANDVEAIRVALGYDRWNLYGISYGTRLGLEVLRHHPDPVRSAVLDSVYPPDVDSVVENPHTFVDSWDAVIEACDREPACAADGDLGDRMKALARRLQADPVEVTVEDWISDESDQMQLTGDALVGIVTQALYSPSWFSDLPELATDLESGNTEVAETFLSQMRTTERFFSSGMFYAVACRDEISWSDPEALMEPADPFGLRPRFDLASNIGAAAYETCAAFDNGQAPALADQPVTSEVPVLLMAGAYDPITPVSWAAQAAATLPNSHTIVGPNQSHAVSTEGCGMDLVLAFLDSPELAPDGDCLGDEDLVFLAPADGGGPSEVEWEQVSYPATGVELEVSTVTTIRPVGWTVGSLEGDAYRQGSFLDPTQLYQLAGDDGLAIGLGDFLESTWDVEITENGTTEAGGRVWRLRRAGSDTVTVRWFQADLDGGDRLFVILVSTPAELEANLAGIVDPILTTIQAD